jgi:hypothetical protein
MQLPEAPAFDATALVHSGEGCFFTRRRLIGGPDILRAVDLLARSLKPLALVRVTAPSRDRTHRLVSSGRIRQEVEAALLAVASGSTTFNGLGAWKSGGPYPVREESRCGVVHAAEVQQERITKGREQAVSDRSSCTSGHALRSRRRSADSASRILNVGMHGPRGRHAA